MFLKLHGIFQVWIVHKVWLKYLSPLHSRNWKWPSVFNMHTDHLGELIKVSFWLRRSGVGLDILHFWEVSSWCWCCWSHSDILWSKNLSDKLKIYKVSRVSVTKFKVWPPLSSESYTFLKCVVQQPLKMFMCLVLKCIASAVCYSWCLQNNVCVWRRG